MSLNPGRVTGKPDAFGGDILSDSDVSHFYTVANGLIERKDLGESEVSSQQSSSSAISRHQGGTAGLRNIRSHDHRRRACEREPVSKRRAAMECPEA
jgi:hypothetical protein